MMHPCQLQVRPPSELHRRLVLPSESRAVIDAEFRRDPPAGPRPIPGRSRQC